MSEVEFGGETFRTADSIGLMALMRFAHVAKGGTDSNDMAGLAAMYDLLEQCFPAEEFDRFQQVALRTKAKGDELMAVVGKVVEAISARPTGRPSDSSAGPAVIEPSSGDASSSEAPHLRVVRHWEEKGRPDVAFMVQMAQEGMASAG